VIEHSATRLRLLQADAKAFSLARSDPRVIDLVRRSIDITVSTLLLLATSPLLMLVAAAVRLESPGPVIFRQQRLGRHGFPFRFYKFRGMYADAHERWPELEEHNYSQEEVADLRFHPTHDPRVTRVGRLIRRTSLDELPNLWNVLKGDMTLVGPRPEIPEMIPYYGTAAPVVLSVKPGVTSLAKVTGRDELTFSKTLALDVEYVERRSLRLDLKIMLATAATVILQRGVLPG
jgi:lipopolysaccharide/colanic/teichoic acid biosynthesis glycosyltransferase